MNEQEVREFEENIVKGANIAFQRLVNQKKKEEESWYSLVTVISSESKLLILTRFIKL